MDRYLAPSPAARAAAQRALSGIETIAVLENPNGKTISARRMGTCPISGDKIHPGDSITKTDEGWALTEHVGGALENPGLGGSAMRYAKKHGVSLKEAWRAVKGGAKENPSKGGAAMKYARAHGVSLKEGWAAVKAGRANPRTFAGGMSRTQRSIHAERQHSRREDRKEGSSLAALMASARPGSRSMRLAHQELAEANRRKRRSFAAAHTNPAKEMQVQAIAQEILHEWPTINPNAESALFFMLHPNYITGGDTIDHVVGSFLANATTWRGESARRIKAQLNALLR
jgi:hypothetical protein